MDLLEGKTLLQKGGEEIAADVALKKKTLILFYFTIPNAEACKLFDYKLMEIYQEALIRKVEMAVIVVPADIDKEAYKSILKTTFYEWLSVRLDDDLIRILPYNYGVTHVPTLVVIKKDGMIVTRNGVPDIEQIGLNVLVTWTD